MSLNRILSLLSPIAALLLVSLSCGGGAKVLQNSQVRVDLTPAAGLAMTYLGGGQSIQLTTGAEAAFSLLDKDGAVVPLVLTKSVSGNLPQSSPFAPGKTLELSLSGPQGSPLSGVGVEITLALADKLPGAVIGNAVLTGLTPEALANFGGTRFYALSARADLADKAAKGYDFRLFQGPAYTWGDWYTRISLKPGYSAPNSTVRTDSLQDNGGGFPLLYLWTRQAGLALEMIDTTSRVAALPVSVREDGSVSLALTRPAEFIRPDANGRAEGLPVLIGAFQGDYFPALAAYGKALTSQGFRFAPTTPADYEGIWCSWGFRREVTREDILKTLPTVKKLGLKWAVMDDGYQIGIGDWPLDPKKFPRGDADMRALVDSIHAAGLKAKLWWVPMNVSRSDPLYEKHPEWVVLNKEGKPKHEQWWDCDQLCPALPEVVEQQRALVKRFMVDWDFDGFKMDGGCQDMAGPCYNPAHHHARPEEACEATAALYRMIYEEAQKYKPGAVLEVCECGIPPSPYKLAWYTQEVAADPVSSEQVRARIKMYKALLGKAGAPYGDHVELSNGWYVGKDSLVENGHDFASTLALGGVIGTKFTALVEDTVGLDWRQYKGLRPLFEKWIALYNSLELYQGDYLNLYDTGWDFPEAHVVAKGDTLYYGFFEKDFAGRLELRGLKDGVKYSLSDYANADSPLGEVTGGATAGLDCAFKDQFLVRAAPEE